MGVRLVPGSRYRVTRPGFVLTNRVPTPPGNVPRHRTSRWEVKVGAVVEFKRRNKDGSLRFRARHAAYEGDLVLRGPGSLQQRITFIPRAQWAAAQHRELG